MESLVTFVLWLLVFAGIGAVLWLWYQAWRLHEKRRYLPSRLHVGDWDMR